MRGLIPLFLRPFAGLLRQLKTTRRRLFAALFSVAAISFVLWAVLPAHRLDLAAALSAAVTMLALAYPALRQHEQARAIAEIHRLEGAIGTQEEQLRQARYDSEAAARERESLKEDKDRLEAIKDQLIGSLGSWTPLVDLCIAIGYIAFAVATVLQIYLALSPPAPIG